MLPALDAARKQELMAAISATCAVVAEYMAQPTSMPLYLRIAHGVRTSVQAHINGARSFDDEGKSWLVWSLRRAKPVLISMP